MLREAGFVRPTGHRREAQLDMIVFPTTELTNFIRARRLGEDLEAAAGAWEIPLLTLHALTVELSAARLLYELFGESSLDAGVRLSKIVCLISDN